MHYILFCVTVTCLTTNKKLPGNQIYYHDDIVPDSCKFNPHNNQINFKTNHGVRHISTGLYVLIIFIYSNRHE